jgi:hypothetical protein
MRGTESSLPVLGVRGVNGLSGRGLDDPFQLLPLQVQQDGAEQGQEGIKVGQVLAVGVGAGFGVPVEAIPLQTHRLELQALSRSRYTFLRNDDSIPKSQRH